MISMLLHELKQYQKTTIIWTVCLIAGAGFYLSLYPAFAQDIEAVQKLIENFPAAFRDALGLTPDMYGSIIGFYRLTLSFIILAGAIQAMNIGTSIVSKEESENTAEFLLVKPVRRSKILTSKLVASLTLLLITNIIYLVSVPIVVKVLADATIDLEIYVLMTLTLLFVQVFFLALGFLISVVAPKIRSVLSISLSTVFGFYIIGMLDTLLGAKTIRYVTPFKFYDLEYIAKNHSYEPVFIVIEVIFVTVAIAASYYIYSKRDIHTL